MNKLYICEFSFLDEDRDNPGYSMAEPDYYAWIPTDKRSAIPNHRLSLRKNLVTGEWEFYRAYTNQANVKILQNRKVLGHMITFNETGIEEIAFKTKDFEEALRFGNAEWKRMHGGDGRDDDKPCTHGGSGSTSAMFCPVVKGLVDPAAPKSWR